MGLECQKMANSSKKRLILLVRLLLLVILLGGLAWALLTSGLLILGLMRRRKR